MRKMHSWKLMVVAILCLTAGTMLASTGREAITRSPSVFSIVSTPYGNSYADWAAAWWQWAFSLPVSDNPLFDETGGKCGNGQSGPVFFLAGVFNDTGSAVRDLCVVPSGKALFFPVVNVECSNVEGNGDTPATLRACAAGFAELATGLAVEIDGVSISGLPNFRVISPAFAFTLPVNNLLGAAGGACITLPSGACRVPFLSAGDGFYLMVAPLSDGSHTIHFKGTFGPPVNFTTDVTYHLIIGA